MTFRTWNSGGYVWYRRGIPRYPRMNWGKKVRLNPTNTTNAANSASAAGYIFPQISGHH